ncbi:MAG: hypothetical protein A2180_02970 [Pseudomonadales bacterium GWC2_63_15]|nr:MAG: hypothetical protein A2180_02970 [Pseudomonadales bacterium GWC2_63_15]
MQKESLFEFSGSPIGTGRLVDAHRTVRRHQWEELQQVGIAHANATVGKRYAHRLTIGGAVNVDVTAEGIDLPLAIDSRLAPAEPENPGQDPVTTGRNSVKLRGPYLPCPAPPTQHRTLRQTVTEARAHLMQTAWRATRTVQLARTIACRRDRKAQTQLALGEAIELLIGDGNMQKIEKCHGRLA